MVGSERSQSTMDDLDDAIEAAKLGFRNPSKLMLLLRLIKMMPSNSV